jgi:hypothetical protein
METITQTIRNRHDTEDHVIKSTDGIIRHLNNDYTVSKYSQNETPCQLPVFGDLLLRYINYN